MIVSIKIGEQMFILVDKNKAAEVIQSDPRIFGSIFRSKTKKKT